MNSWGSGGMNVDRPIPISLVKDEKHLEENSWFKIKRKELSPQHMHTEILIPVKN